MWPEQLLDAWDGADEHERKLILETWPRWQQAVAQIESERADGKQQQVPQTRARKGMGERAERGRKAQAKRRKRKQRRDLQEATA